MEATKSACEIVPSTIDHVVSIGEELREEDRKELIGFGYKNPKTAIMSSFLVSELCWTLLHDGEPVAIGGAAESLDRPGLGIPWFLATPKVNSPEVRLALAVRSPRYIEEMHKKFPELENWISAQNQKTQAWLRWLGFQVGPAQVREDASIPACRIWRQA
jgi:hypothetical protein